MAEASDGFHEFGLAVPLHPGDAKDLAGTHLERNVAHRHAAALPFGRQSLHFQHDALGMGRALGHLQNDLAPDHHLGKRRLRGLFRQRLPHHATVAHGHDAVRDLEHLAQLVRDEDERVPRPGQPAHDAK